MITVYGIPNCDSVKKARLWLAENGHATQFHDFKKQGVPETALDAWLAALGWEVVLNKQGTTWKKLPDEVKLSVQDAASAKAVRSPAPEPQRPVGSRPVSAPAP